MPPELMLLVWFIVFLAVAVVLIWCIQQLAAYLPGPLPMVFTVLIVLVCLLIFVRLAGREMGFFGSGTRSSLIDR